MTARFVAVLVLEMDETQARQSPPTVWDWAQIAGPEVQASRVLQVSDGQPLQLCVSGRNIAEEPSS